MAQIREIRKRIKSIGNTQKVTHAMELVSAAKMRKAQAAALSARPYSINLTAITNLVKNKLNFISHPLLDAKDSKNQIIILVTSDRGLAGGLNLNLFREILRGDIKDASYLTVGKKALVFASKIGSPILASFTSEEKEPIELSGLIAKIVTDAYISNQAFKVNILYTHFESTIKQTPKWVQILPIELAIEPTDLPASPAKRGEPSYPLRPRSEASHPTDLIFEPSIESILQTLLPHYLLTQIYQILLEAKAAEHSARMVAMKNATDAAGELIDDLTLFYNQARQETITKELSDIITAQKAVE